MVATISRSRDEARFETGVDDARARIVTRLEGYVTLLRSGAAFFSVTDAVSSAEFETFVQRLRLGELYPGIQGVGYSVRVPMGMADSLVAARRLDGSPNFQIWPEPAGSDELHAIAYILPMDDRNQAALGYNMYSEPVRRAAMAQARDTGFPAMSGRVTLVQEIEGTPQAGFLIYLPVYEGGKIPADEAERRALLNGFVYAPFRADDLFAGIFGVGESPDVAFRVFDGAAVDSTTMLHDSAVQGLVSDEHPRFQDTELIDIAGRTWTIQFLTTADFESNTRRDIALLVFILGLGTSIILFLLTRQQAMARADAEALAVQLRGTTSELARQVDEVQQLNDEVGASNRELERTNQALQGANRFLEELRHEAETAREEADQANRAKSEFLAAMSHELRTPLNAIMGYADLIEMGVHGPTTTEQRNALERIKRSQAHLLALINDILNYAKIEAGRVDVELRPIDVGSILRDLQGMTEPQLKQAGLEAVFHGCHDGVMGLGDIDKVQQILLNLMTNATKFTDRGGRIDVTCRLDGDRILIGVKDTGRGIPLDRLKAIFDPFVQLDRSSSPEGKQGVGLGLAISRDLAVMMKGDIAVKSVVGEGSEFTLMLRRVDANDHPAQTVG